MAPRMHLILFVVRTDDTLDEVPQKQEGESCHWTASGQAVKQDFAGPLASRASRFLGPISRHRVADILRHMKLVSRASRPGLIVCSREATLKAENRGLQCSTAGPYNAFPSLLQVGSICGLGPDLVGIHSISLTARYRVAAYSSTLRKGLEKVNQAHGHNLHSSLCSLSAWERSFFSLP